jgi:hypothetical protein
MAARPLAVVGRLCHHLTIVSICVPTSAGVTEEFGAGFSLQRGPPGEAGSYVRSTGVLRLPATLGDVLCELGQVAGRVQVPVELEPAGLAFEGALGQAELGFHPAAGRARLGRGMEPVGHHQTTAVPGRLVGELAAQFG